jgi:hypothetical protein
VNEGMKPEHAEKGDGDEGVLRNELGGFEFADSINIRNAHDGQGAD